MGWRETLNVHTPKRGDTSDKSQQCDDTSTSVAGFLTSVTSVTHFGQSEKSEEDTPITDHRIQKFIERLLRHDPLRQVPAAAANDVAGLRVERPIPERTSRWFG
jgi:hypothetical protein